MDGGYPRESRYWLRARSWALPCVQMQALSDAHSADEETEAQRVAVPFPGHRAGAGIKQGKADTLKRTGHLSVAMAVPRTDVSSLGSDGRRVVWDQPHVHQQEWYRVHKMEYGAAAKGMRKLSCLNTGRCPRQNEWKNQTNAGTAMDGSRREECRNI